MKLIAEFEIGKLPCMTNAIGRRHWSAKHKERVIWQRLVSEQCYLHKINSLALTKVKLSFVRCSSRPPDFDGLVSGFKVVIDSLVKCGVITDDNVTIVGQPSYTWEHRPTKQGGRVKIKIETED